MYKTVRRPLEKTDVDLTNEKSMKKIVTMILLVLAPTMVGAQDVAHYKRVIKELSSAKYQGRGYAKDGANKAGRFLQREFEKAGVDEVTLQPFKLDINTFCGKMQMWAAPSSLSAARRREAPST